MGRRILVVDDDRASREIIADALEAKGFEVGKVCFGEDALGWMRSNVPPDLVVADLSMCEMAGLDFIEAAKDEFPRTDVIVLVGASFESVLQVMRLGAADYLRKPVQLAEVVHGVKRTLLRRCQRIENGSLRSSVQAYEASRVLGVCLEPGDVLPLTLDIVLRITGRQRAVGRLVGETRSALDSVSLQGFSDEGASNLRARIEREKLFGLTEFMAPGCDEASGRQGDLARHDKLDLAGALSLPLRQRGAVVGCVWVLPDGRDFDEDEIRKSELVVAQAEQALLNAERFLEAREKAFVDDVTDLYNVRYLLAALDREASRSARAGLALSVLFLDLDRFKLVNDQHGHLVGSRVLRELGQLLHRSIRTIDTLGRYGGDEFCMLLVDTDHEAALQVADRIREMVEGTPFGGDRGLALTVSIGVATFPQHGKDRESLLDQADKAMYLGKAQGRNLVCSAEELRGPSL